MYNISKLVVSYFKTASSSLSAQRLSNFKLLPTISQHQFTSFIVFPLSRQKLSNLYVAERALALLVQKCLLFSSVFLLFIHNWVRLLWEKIYKETGENDEKFYLVSLSNLYIKWFWSYYYRYSIRTNG